MSQQKNTTRRSSRKNGRPRSKRGGSPLVMAITWGTSLVAAVVIGFVIINSSAFQSLRTWLAGGSTVAAVDEPNSAADRTEFNQEPQKSGELPSYPLETADAPTTNDNDSELATEDKNGVVLTGHQGPLALPAKPTNQPIPLQASQLQRPASATQAKTPSTDDVSKEPDQDTDELDGVLVIKPGSLSLKPFQVVDPGEGQQPTATGTAIQEEPKPRLPIPDESSQRKVLKEIKSLFADKYSERSPRAKSIFAKDLLETARGAKDPVVKYVCLDEAQDLATEAADMESVWAVVDVLCEDYQVDELELRLAAIKNLSRKLNDPAAMSGLIKRCSPFIDKLIDADQFESASVVAKRLWAIAKKSGNAFARDDLGRLADRLKEMERGYANIQPELKKLKSDSRDAPANQAIGEFYCFIKGDFDKGLIHLSQGTNDSTQKTALMELKGPETVEERLAVADAWWELSESFGNARSDSSLIRRHAASFYLELVTAATGITKKRIESRLAKLGQEISKNGDNSFKGLIYRELVVSIGGPPGIMRFRPDGTCVKIWRNRKYPGKWGLQHKNGVRVLRVETAHSISEFYPRENGFAIERTLLSNGSKSKGSAVFR